jgi:UDP-N-acetyl-D-glucosamine dehydrogenase
LFAGLTDEASEITREFYSKFCDNLIQVSSPEVAEAAKLFENTFRQVNIALVNEFALIMNKMNVPVSEVLDAAASKPYGFMKFTPGIGVGGHCIPVDPIYLEKAAEDAGAEANFIKLANEVNLKMPVEIANRVIVEIGGSIKGKRVLVCGIAYKSNISDTRETPSEILVDYLQSQGANVSWHDPLVESWRSESGVSKLTPGEFDVVIIATLHEAMNQKDLVAAGKYVFDCTGRVPGAVSL